MRQPDAAADDAVVPDMGLAAQDRRAGIDDDTVADVRVAFDALDQRPVLPDGKALGAERHMLVKLDVLPDGRRLADHHAGAVVDEEGFPDRCAGVDVDPGEPVRVLGHHARQKRHPLQIQDVRKPVRADGGKGRIAENDLVQAACGGVAGVGRLQIGLEQPADLRKAVQQYHDHFFRLPPLQFQVHQAGVQVPDRLAE